MFAAKSFVARTLQVFNMRTLQLLSFILLFLQFPLVSSREFKLSYYSKDVFRNTRNLESIYYFCFSTVRFIAMFFTVVCVLVYSLNQSL